MNGENRRGGEGCIAVTRFQFAPVHLPVQCRAGAKQEAVSLHLNDLIPPDFRALVQDIDEDIRMDLPIAVPVADPNDLVFAPLDTENQGKRAAARTRRVGVASHKIMLEDQGARAMQTISQKDSKSTFGREALRAQAPGRSLAGASGSSKTLGRASGS